MLKCYSVFHLNLAYSSIEEKQRREVIEKSYWPLLRLAMEGVPVGIEASGYTLETINELDPKWIGAMRNALESGNVELLGSGYSQLIGPLVPADVNRWNFKFGKDVYRSLLGVEPRVWYVNEQAYSAGLISHYCAVGADAILMEWNNPASAHQEWPEEYQYYPQLAKGTARIPLIWNNSISFQKFQRVVHSDLSIDDYFSYLSQHIGERERAFCIYGSDAEVFDFRPGRFATEPEAPVDHSEWENIGAIFKTLQSSGDFELVFPSAVLQLKDDAAAMKELVLETPACPIPVKKQPKYNISRWALTGGDTLAINSSCFRIYQKIRALPPSHSTEALSEYRKKLCYFWSSDFRTHITEKRRETCLAQLGDLERMLESHDSLAKDDTPKRAMPLQCGGLKGVLSNLSFSRANRSPVQPEEAGSGEGFEIESDPFSLRLVTQGVDLTLNPRRGLAITRLRFPEISSEPLITTIPHGYYRDISLGADWYSGSMVLQRFGSAQVTDLASSVFQIYEVTSGKVSWLECQTKINTVLGPVAKLYKIHMDSPQVDIETVLEWDNIPRSSLKICSLTLMPESFSEKELFFAAHNGGDDFEIFSPLGNEVRHDQPASSVVSASHGLGATEGVVVVGDNQKGFAAKFNQEGCAAMPMIRFTSASPSYIARLLFSCAEVDETAKEPIRGPVKFSISIAGMKGNFRPGINK